MAQALATTGAVADAAAPEGSRILVWDPVVRLFHWGMVAGFALNMFVVEDGKSAHRWIGYGILVAIAVRPRAGASSASRHARFADFMPTPTRLRGYLETSCVAGNDAMSGTTQLAPSMMLLLIALMVACGVTGWMLGLDRFWGSEWLEELHAPWPTRSWHGWAARAGSDHRERSPRREPGPVDDHGIQARAPARGC